MQNWLRLPKASGYSLLEISVSMLIFGLILMIASTSLLGLVEEKKCFGDRQEAYRLAQNLTETILALPLEDAKALEPDEKLIWTAQGRYTVETSWNPYIQDSHFEKVTVEYLKNNHLLIRLSALHPKE